ncbi:MAG: hypothetical protein ACXAD7_14580 [Candidatus Kariarchaeaceae archaeon]
MNSRECSGYLIFHNGKKVDAEIITWVSRSKRWFKGRGILSIEVQNIPSSTGKWHVGIFYCTKLNHDNQDDTFSLSATDTGSIVKKKDEKTEKISIDVAVTRIDDTDERIRRPRVYRG